jgi:nucleotide-binding universal stress UspA family protein
MKTILVATDFSAAALNAAEYAVEMAQVINANITLLHVCQVPVTYGEVPAMVNEGDMIHDAELSLLRLKDDLLSKTKKTISISTAVTTGIFFSELKKCCEDIMPYTIVMGCQGTSAVDHFLLGSHAVHAVKNLDWPLITVPPGATFTAIKKIGLACDLNKVVDTTPVEEIKLLLNDFKAELHVLNTGKQKTFDPDIIFESGLLQEMLIDVKPQYHFITSENIDDGIIEFADKNKIDLLVVLPKRHRLLDMLFHKSHTKNLVLHSHVPVMALHH